MVYKLVLPVDSSGYTVNDGIPEVIRTSLPGGAARYRKDIEKSSKLVQCTFPCSGSEYQYLRAFYRTWRNNPSQPFLADLVIDDYILTTHECYFIPETFQLVSQSGMAYTVQAQLEVRPLDYDSGIDETLVALAEEYGLSEWETYVDIINTIINVDFPGYDW